MEQETVSMPAATEKGKAMCKSRIATILLAAMAVALVQGCVTLGKGLTDEELIRRGMEELKTALEAQDLDKIMAAHSEDFEGEYGGKAEWREFLAGAVEQGLLDDAEVNLEDAEIEIDGDTATISPVTVITMFGDVTYEYVARKEEDGVWRIIESHQY